MEKTTAKNGSKECQWGSCGQERRGGRISKRMVREGLPEKVTFDLDLQEVREYAGWIPEGSENGQDQGLEAEVYLLCVSTARWQVYLEQNMRYS